MQMSRRASLGLLTGIPLLAGASAEADDISAAMSRIKPLFKPKSPPQAGEWLSEHKEPGQTYQQFRTTVRKRVVEEYSTLRIVPIGSISEGHAAALEITMDFLRSFFGLDLVVDAAVRINEIPAHAQRILYQGSPKQLLTSHILQNVLPSRRTVNDAAVLGITAFDLWPGPGWNFVFGQASLTQRVGVWSMARNGNPNDRPAMRNVCAIRTAMTTTHETGHMLGIRHCIAYQCGMNGSNHSSERDRQPLEFCPECQAKLWWTCGVDPLARSRALEAVAGKYGFERLLADFARQSKALATPGFS